MCCKFPISPSLLFSYHHRDAEVMRAKQEAANKKKAEEALAAAASKKGGQVFKAPKI